MRETLEGRRLGFALRPVFGTIALGLALATMMVDLGAWFGWGARDTNAFVWAAYWLSAGAALFSLLGAFTAIAEIADVPAEERSLARIDFAILLLALLALGASAGVRSTDLGAAGATPAALLLAVLGIVALVAGVLVGGNLYAPREWEEIFEELPRERHPRRRSVSR